jgi:hypothetical protein
MTDSPWWLQGGAELADAEAQNSKRRSQLHGLGHRRQGLLQQFLRHNHYGGTETIGGQAVIIINNAHTRQ